MRVRETENCFIDISVFLSIFFWGEGRNAKKNGFSYPSASIIFKMHYLSFLEGFSLAIKKWKNPVEEKLRLEKTILFFPCNIYFSKILIKCMDVNFFFIIVLHLIFSHNTWKYIKHNDLICLNTHTGKFKERKRIFTKK